MDGIFHASLVFSSLRIRLVRGAGYMESSLPIPTLLTVKDAAYEGAKRSTLNLIWDDYRHFLEVGVIMSGAEFANASQDYFAFWEGEKALGEYRRSLVDQYEAKNADISYANLEYGRAQLGLHFIN